MIQDKNESVFIMQANVFNKIGSKQYQLPLVTFSEKHFLATKQISSASFTFSFFFKIKNNPTKYLFNTSNTYSNNYLFLKGFSFYARTNVKDFKLSSLKISTNLFLPFTESI